MKKCSVCKNKKVLNEFYGRSKLCKICHNLKTKKNYKKNRKKILEYAKTYRENNKQKISDYQKIYTRNNKLKKSEYDKQYVKKNIVKKRIYFKNYIKERIKNDPLFKLRHNIKRRILHGLDRLGCSKSNKKTVNILGCSYSFLKNHLQDKFKQGMTWENHGAWHIDHIIPLSSAKTEKELYKLFHYTNLQPLWATENLKKSNKICE